MVLTVARPSRWHWLEKLRRVLVRRDRGLAPPLLLPPRPASKPRRYLAIAAICKDGAPYLAEWIAFHRLVGVEHVFLYDNGSTDDWMSAVAPFIEEGFVTPIQWATFDANTSFSTQNLQTAHAISNFGPDFRWMVNLDIDEFLFPVVGDDVRETLEAYEDLPSLAVPWIMYGFCGHNERPEGLVIENYTMRAPFPPERKRKGIFKWKAILNPSEVAAVYSPHSYKFYSGLFGGGLDENRNPISNATRYDFPRTANVLRINHYTTRSKSEFAAKLKLSTAGRQSVSAAQGRRQKFADLSNLDVFQDSTILRFVPKLKQSLGVGDS
jgi:hypothetical protein